MPSHRDYNRIEMKVKVTAVFDIGKTNKKFFLFDKDFQEVYREYIRFDEIEDEDGYPTENLEALEDWTKDVFEKMFDSAEFEIEALNFSCYGASLVHIGGNGKPLTPLYNYTKPLNDEIHGSFYAKYGSENQLSRITGSPKLEMLNTGMHLFWLKHTKSEIFKKIKYSLHLPQYLSYLFTGIAVSEYTSIGCHTMLWDYEKKDYHVWVYQEEINEKLPPIVLTQKTIAVFYKGKIIKVGVGVHDSSSALLPYVRSITKPFLLVSTGTWSIAMNPFNEGMLTSQDIGQNCLFNMRPDGKPVRVSRLFLGNEYEYQIKLLSKMFKLPDDYHKEVKFDQGIISEINKDFNHMFRWSSLSSGNMPQKTKIIHTKFEHAYHQLMMELVLLQGKSIKSAMGNKKIERLYIDGGFSDNEVYIQLLSQYLRNMKLGTTDSSSGSGLGAALVIDDRTLPPGFLKKNYALKNIVP